MQAAKLAGPATLAVSGALLFVAFFFGDGISDGRLFWIGAFAALGAIVLLGWSVPVPRGLGLACLALLAALALWVGLTMAWSVAPDLSWAAFNRLLVYLAFALLGVLATQVRQPARTIAGGLALLLGLVLCWALLGKVIPSLFPDGARVARLRNPIGYWNSLALAAATAVPLLRSGSHRRAAMRGGCGRWGCCSSTWPSWRSCSRTRAPASRSPRSRRSAGSAVSRDRLESLAALAVATPCRRARRALGVLAAGAHRRPPGLCRPRGRRRLVRRPARGRRGGCGRRRLLARRARAERPGAHRLDATARVACRDRRPRRGRGRARGQGRSDPGRVPRHRRQGGLADSDAPRRAQLEQPLALVAGGVVAVEGRAARGEGRGDLRDRPARHPRRARSPRRSRTTSRSSSWPRPGSSASCSCSARSGPGRRRRSARSGGRKEASARLQPPSRSASARTSSTGSSTSTGSSWPSRRPRSSCSGR